MLKRAGKWLVDIFGFRKNSPYVKSYFNEANIRSSVYMSFIVIVLEIWMILRYIVKYMLPSEVPVTPMDFWTYTKNFWELLVVALAMLLYAVNYLRSRQPNQLLGAVFIIFFAFVCLSFGMEVSFNDFSNGKQILCFVTMVLFVACLLIWKPYVSLLMLGVIFLSFYYRLSTESGIEIRSGDKVNYITLFISLTMICFSIYKQRISDATKSEKLERIAIEDDLTRVYNLRYFTQEAEKLMAQPDSKTEEKLYLYFNIENFKIYNDQRGFKAGNEFLEAVGTILMEELPGSLVARQSDDHFVALTDIEGVEDRLERIRQRIKEYEKEIYLPLKVGGFRPTTKDSHPRRCIDHARYACSLIRNMYGEMYREYDQQTHENFQKRQYVINHIDTAIEKGYIKVYYQPVVWSKDGTLCGCEALARWIDPGYGFLSPGDFIPVLEDCRQIHKLDTCIYEIVCRDLRRSIDNGLPVVPVSLNFSRLDFELMDAVSALDNVVEKYNLPKKLLHVEITESALTSNMQGLMDAVERFRDKGYAIWLDDFGSGYSSLNTLKDFQFDVLKIDMQFLENFSNNPKSKDIIASIVELSDKLHMRTLTEGVETQEQADFLEAIGCGRLQGYFFGKPMEYDSLYACINDGTYIVSDHLNG